MSDASRELLILLTAKDSASPILQQMARDLKAIDVAAGAPRVSDLSHSFATLKESLIDPGKLKAVTDEVMRLQVAIAKGGDASRMATLGKEVAAAEASFKSLTGTATQSAGGINAMMAGGVKAALGFAGVTGGIMAVQKLGDTVGDAINNASALHETINKSQVVFAGGAGAVEAFGNTAAKSIGMSKQQAVEATATFGNLFEASGMGKSSAQELSTSLVKLAADLASFNNASPTEVLEALRSGMVGEVEPLRRFGVNLLDSNVQMKAQAMGLREVNGVLSDTDRMMARFALIMDQTKTAQGDFARTSDALANSQRILNAQMGDLSARMGGALLPLELMGVHAMTKVMDTLDNVGAKMQETRMVASAGIVGSGELVSEQARADAQSKAQSIEDALVAAANNSSRAWRQMETDFSTTMSNMVSSSIAASDAMEVARGRSFGAQEADRNQAKKAQLEAAAAASDLADSFNRVSSPDVLKQQGAAMIADYNTNQAKLKSERDRAASEAIANANRVRDAEIAAGRQAAEETIKNLTKVELASTARYRTATEGKQSELDQVNYAIWQAENGKGDRRELGALYRKQEGLQTDIEGLGLAAKAIAGPEELAVRNALNPALPAVNLPEFLERISLAQRGEEMLKATFAGTNTVNNDVSIQINGTQVTATGGNDPAKARQFAELVAAALGMVYDAPTSGQGGASPQLSGAPR